MDIKKRPLSLSTHHLNGHKGTTIPFPLQTKRQKIAIRGTKGTVLFVPPKEHKKNRPQLDRQLYQ